MDGRAASIKRAAAACDLLESAFPGRVTTPDAASEYEMALTMPWSQTCWTPAAAYVQLRTSQEIVDALAIVRETGSNFAIRGAGHNPNAGFSSADETGVVLDLRLLDAKSLDDNGLARVGAGSTWGNVYTWLEDHGLSTVGGRDEEVGLAGFLLGGGLPAFPNLHGLGADNVKNFEVVLADGRQVSANLETNKDLFRALKGGGTNFGIVTRIDLETFPLLKVQFRISLYDPSDFVDIIDATCRVQEAMDEDPKIGLFTNFNNGFVAVGLLYADLPTEQPKAFEPFINLKSLINNFKPTTNGTLLSVAQAMAHPPVSQNVAISTASTKVSRQLYANVHKACLEIRKSLPEGVVLHYSIQPVATGCYQVGENKGGNTLGLAEVSHTWWVFTCEWPKGVDGTAAQKAVQDMAQNVRTFATEMGLLLEYLSMSFASGSQGVLRSYGVENVRNLQEVAAKYDPEGVFQQLQYGGFLLRDLD